MKRYIIAFFFAFLLCLSLPYRLSCYAIQQSTLDVPFDNFSFTLSDSQVTSLQNGNYKYYILLVHSKSSFTDEDRQYGFQLFALNDNLVDNNKFYFHKSDSKDRFPPQGSFTVGSDLIQYSGISLICQKASSKITGAISFTSNTSSASYSGGRFCSSDMLVMDFYNQGNFPYYYVDLPPTYNPTSCVMASNCDIYNDNGDLLQYGSYDRLLQLIPSLGNFCSDLSDNIAPTERPTYTGYEAEQTSNSRSIIQKITDLWYSIRELPSLIASAISGFFDSLGDRISGFFDTLLDGILSGLQFLFVPSDNLFIDLMDMLHSKFAFIFQIFEISDFIIHRDWSGQTPPEFNISLPQSWGGQTLTTFDTNFWFVLSDQWHSFIQNFVSGILIFFAIRKLKKRLPDIINSVSSHDGGDS